MTKPDRNSPSVRAFLKALGNPYAAEQMFDNPDEDMSAEEKRRAEIRLHQNPYRTLADEPADPALAPRNRATPASRRAVSKTDFQVGCRRIFEQYIPPLEQRRLRSHHRDFIVRNQDRSPTARRVILRELQKYDLSGQGFKPQFNRELDAITEQKLREIERLADAEESI